MLRSLPRLGLALGMLLLAALPAGADIYHVKLKSGTVVDTRYQPQDASWDKGMVLLLTEVGNWVGVPKDEIESVTAENATRGFGVTIRNNTISLGVAPNDQPNPNDKDKGTAALDRLTQAIQGLSQGQQQQPYTIQQGVSSEQTQGIPANFINNGGGQQPPVSIQLPPLPTPAAPAPSAPAPPTSQQ
jgi:hypothetical protein